MPRPLTLAATLLATPALAQQDPLTILSWGGDFAAMQDQAMAQPFSAQTGMPVRFVDTDDPAGMVLGGLPVDGAVLASAREHGLHLREHGLHGGGIGRHAHLLQVTIGIGLFQDFEGNSVHVLSVPLIFLQTLAAGAAGRRS